MKRTIQIELELEKETPDFLDKVMGRIYIMDEVKKTGMEAKYVEQKESEDERRTNPQSRKNAPAPARLHDDGNNP